MSAAQEVRDARKAYLDALRANSVTPAAAEKARISAYKAAHAESIAAQRERVQAGVGERLQRAAAVRVRAFPSKLPAGATPYDIYQMRSRAHTQIVTERIAAATAKKAQRA